MTPASPPLYTIIPMRTRVSQAVRLAHAAGADLWLTREGKVLIAPRGLPGWRRLPITTPDTTPCAA